MTYYSAFRVYDERVELVGDEVDWLAQGIGHVSVDKGAYSYAAREVMVVHALASALFDRDKNAFRGALVNQFV